MKLKLIVLSLLLFPVLLHSQLKSSLDIIASVDHVFRTLNENSETPVIVIRELNEKGALRGRFGFNYNRQLSKKLTLKTGVRFANIGYLVKEDDDIIWGSEFDPIEGYVNDPSLPMKLKLTEAHYFIEVPLVARYELSKKKFSLFVEAGLSPNIYLSTRTKQVLDGETTSETIDGIDFFGFSRLHLVGSLSFGINYTLNESWQIFAQPIGRYHITSLTRNAPIKENLYTLGLELGVRKFL